MKTSARIVSVGALTAFSVCAVFWLAGFNFDKRGNDAAEVFISVFIVSGIAMLVASRQLE